MDGHHPSPCIHISSLDDSKDILLGALLGWRPPLVDAAIHLAGVYIETSITNIILIVTIHNPSWMASEAQMYGPGELGDWSSSLLDTNIDTVRRSRKVLATFAHPRHHHPWGQGVQRPLSSFPPTKDWIVFAREGCFLCHVRSECRNKQRFRHMTTAIRPLLLYCYRCAMLLCTAAIDLA